MATRVEAFKCDYCGKLVKSKRTAAVHEASCRNNPAKRHCITCIHGIYASYKTFGDWNHDIGEPRIVVEHGPCCGFFNKPISSEPYTIDCEQTGYYDMDGYWKETPERFTCHHYKSKSKAKWTPEDKYDGGSKDEH